MCIIEYLSIKVFDTKNNKEKTISEQWNKEKQKMNRRSVSKWRNSTRNTQIVNKVFTKMDKREMSEEVHIIVYV